MDDLADQLSNIERGLDNVAEAARRIAHGDSYPTGFESLVMALCGEGHDGRNPGSDRPVVYSLDRIADGLQAIAEAITAHTEAILGRP